ncbi:MAG: PAS domain S-box protein [Bacteroidia bacterium]
MENKFHPHLVKRLFSFKLVLASSVFLGALVLTQLLAHQQLNLYKAAQKEARDGEALAVKGRLESTFKSSVAITSALGFIVENEGIPENFDEVARILLTGTRSIDAIQLFDSGTITHVYPLEGNEAAIGKNVLADPARNKEALTAIEKKELFFAGPITLKQGGIGIVGRLPLFRNGNFIGFSAVLINLNTFVESAGISPSLSGIYRYQLIKTNVNTGEEEQFFPGEQIVPYQISSVVTLEEGNWKLYVQNRNHLGWYEVRWVSILGLLLAILGGLISYRLGRQPNKLRMLVVEKRQELIRERQKFKDSFSHSAFGKALIHIPSERISDYNSRFLEILGIERANFSAFWEMPWKYQCKPDVPCNSEFIITQPNGSEHWISLNISPLNDEYGEYSHICTVFDITEAKTLQLEVQQAFQQRNEILESIGDAFFSLDQELNITYWNKQAESLLLHKRDAVLGKNLLNVFGEFINMDDIKRHTPQISQGQALHFKQHIPRLEKWFDVSIYPFKMGTAIYFSDITETVHHVEAIEKRNEKLSEIAWIQSHIVRAPLARMMGIINLLEMGELDERETLKLRKQLLITAHELDTILFTIVEKANLIEKEVKEVLA